MLKLARALEEFIWRSPGYRGGRITCNRL